MSINNIIHLPIFKYGEIVGGGNSLSVSCRVDECNKRSDHL
jgi:hypothetical protein